ncbi:hypothetical protein [Amycolatopsis nigrescens]|uniref:hypothetical protein n=1 Tax=Amycolatopsis nigrescens TaxID=381445 RepID=UPI00037D589D|nr:hypothetical protein [Amycolatopsis nigrescens]
MDIPPLVRSYLATDDGMVRNQLLTEHPEVQEQLTDPRTRRAVLDWLGGEEARQAGLAGFVAGCLSYLRTHAVPEEAVEVRPFTLHPEPVVRVKAYEVLLTLYYPDKNREALLMVLQAMLADPADAVRTQGAHFVASADARQELDAFLAGWAREAPGKGWDTGQAAWHVRQLLDPGAEG